MQTSDSSINSKESLEAAIKKLEEQQKEDIRVIKLDMKDAYESLKPVNVIKTLVSEMFTSPQIRDNLLQSGLGLGAGYLAKVAVVGKSHNPFKRMMGSLIQTGVTNMINSHTDEIQSKGKNLLQRLIKRYKHKDDSEQDDERTIEDREDQA